ncbi:MAG: flavodoxin domain-containing protein [Anaerolineales bacterium]|nr:flavodoxin domain-containing protein [Anaerolineales bacterium]
MSAQKLSRRDFLKLSGLTLGATAVACSGLGYAATRTPRLATPELTFRKDDSMNQHILITYATRAGSTAEIAVAIGETLAGRGFGVDVKPVKANPALDGYDAVILGSAVRMGNWLPEMVDFVKRNQIALGQLPVALFTVHMLNLGADETSHAARLAYLNSVRPLLKPVDEAFFAGKIDLETLSFVDRLIVKMVGAAQKNSSLGDLRNWSEIQAWSSVVF